MHTIHSHFSARAPIVTCWLTCRNWVDVLGNYPSGILYVYPVWYTKMPPKKAAAGPSKKNVEKKKDKVIEASSVLEVWGFLFFLFLVTCVVVSISIAHSIHFHPSMFIHSFHRQRQNYVKASRLGLSIGYCAILCPNFYWRCTPRKELILIALIHSINL